jgi:hypothetical protein
MQKIGASYWNVSTKLKNMKHLQNNFVYLGTKNLYYRFKDKL